MGFLIFLTGVLKKDAKPFLIDVQYTSRTNHATVAHIVVQALKNVLGELDIFQKVLLLLTDSAAYMHKMAAGISSLLPNCLHITCLAHGLHRIAETIRTQFRDVDALIANGKKVFRKAPRRISMFREKNPDLPLPPSPCLTRWGTWLSAALYYAEHFEAIKETVGELDQRDAESISVLNEIFQNPELQTHLVFIKAHFTDIPVVLTKLQSRSLTAPAAWRLFSDVLHPFFEIQLPKLQQKVRDVLQRNSGLLQLIPILQLLDPTCSTLELSLGKAPDLSVSALAAFNFAPLTTVDVERSFSRYKGLLRSDRTNFTEENLRKYMFVMCNDVRCADKVL